MEERVFTAPAFGGVMVIFFDECTKNARGERCPHNASLTVKEAYSMLAGIRVEAAGPAGKYMLRRAVGVFLEQTFSRSGGRLPNEKRDELVHNDSGAKVMHWQFRGVMKAHGIEAIEVDIASALDRRVNPTGVLAVCTPWRICSPVAGSGPEVTLQSLSVAAEGTLQDFRGVVTFRDSLLIARALVVAAETLWSQADLAWIPRSLEDAAYFSYGGGIRVFLDAEACVPKGQRRVETNSTCPWHPVHVTIGDEVGVAWGLMLVLMSLFTNTLTNTPSSALGLLGPEHNHKWKLGDKTMGIKAILSASSKAPKNSDSALLRKLLVRVLCGGGRGPAVSTDGLTLANVRAAVEESFAALSEK